MSAKKILWMADESIESSRPEQWDVVFDLAKQLTDEITPRNIEHEVVNPIECWDFLVRQLQEKDFSTIIDLSGFFTPSLRILFPQADIIDDFSISRLFEITSDGARSIGHITSMTPDQIRRRKETLDMSHTLIIDDTTFSGTSNEMVMQMWGLSPEQTTHASLLMNRGILITTDGRTIIGAQEYLQDKGVHVYFGKELITPDNNGWHLKDLYKHPHIEQAFALLTAKQSGYTNEELQLLFPYRIDSATIGQMHEEERVFTTEPLTEGASYTRNPLMWATSHLRANTDLSRIQEEADAISHTLRRLYDLTVDPQNKMAARLGLAEHTRQFIANTPEGNFSGKEGK